MNSRRRKHAISIRLHLTFLENENHIQLVDYLLMPETKNTPVYIVMEIISLQGVIKSQIVRLGKLFYVSMEGVLSVWTMGTLQNCTSQYVCKRCKKGKHHISICEVDPLGKHNDSNNDKEGGNNSTDKDNSILLATQGVKTRAYFYRLP